MAKIIIHVGPHKTGSTYIQFGLLLNRETLKHNGVTYPDTFCTHAIQWCHFGLFQMLREGRYAEVSARFAALAQEEVKIIVLSSEDLSDLTEDALTALRAAIGDDVEVIFYVRRWSELLPSAAQEDIRQGATRTLPEMCLHHLAAPYASETLNYSIKIERFARVFGTASLRLVSFNNVLESHLDLFTHFADQVLGINSADLTLPTQKHESQSIQKIEILRALNGVRRLKQEQRGPWNAEVVISKLATHDLAVILEAMGAHESFVLLDERARPFADIYDDLVKAFGGCFLSPYANDLPFVRQKRRIPYIRADYLLTPGVVESLVDIYAEVAE